MRGIRTACIILPTYNEAGNITEILDRIYSEVGQQNRVRFFTLVVDDNSPDGTAQLALDYAEKNIDVHVLQRPGKEGLGMAYIAGMKHALREIRPDVIYEMDADGSHDPKDILRLLDTIEKGADMTIGSRYVHGGSLPTNWGFYRKLNSSVANGLVRNVLALNTVRDCTGGFRAIRTSFLEHVDFDRLNSKGYAFQISLLAALSRLGANIVEVPIHFTDRKIGASKMRLKDQIEFVVVTFRIRAARDKLAAPVQSTTAQGSAAKRITKKG